MSFSFKKNIIVGVAVTPELGLEAALIDFDARKVLKYGTRTLAYDNNRKVIADLDIFKESLQDVLQELDIPKGADIVLSIPTVFFNVNDYPAALSTEQIGLSIETDLMEKPLFSNEEPCISAVKLPNSTMQFSKFAYVAAQKTTLIEIAMQIYELGYNLVSIDTSINSSLNALIYNERVNASPQASWLLLVVENSCCRIIPMSGKNYVDYFEEKISIGEVLGDEENYTTVVSAVKPILKNNPTQCLYVVSKTNIISAKLLAEKLTYEAPIVHQEANIYNTVPFIDVSDEINPEAAKTISLDVIGAAIGREFADYTETHFNLFNESLGDVYIQNRPPVITIGSRKFEMSMENSVKYGLIFFVLVLIAALIILLPIRGAMNGKKQEKEKLDRQIQETKAFIEANKGVSSSVFSESDEIRIGLGVNKNVYTYYTIAGTEIPKKLWLTSLELGPNTTIKGQADNLESIYSFFRSIKDYNPESGIKLQKLGLAVSPNKRALRDFDTDSVITSLNADYYEFVISDVPEKKATSKKSKSTEGVGGIDDNSYGNNEKPAALPDLETID